MTNLLNIERIVELLEGMNISYVSRETGIHRNTLSAIADRENTNPNYETVKTLSEFFSNR